jgi:NADPH:quinone reductase-like Zn-dependent oxidoreductase
MPAAWPRTNSPTKVIRKYPLPIVMGNELSGFVEAVDRAVTRFAKGDRVFARVDKDIMGARRGRDARVLCEHQRRHQHAR